MVLSAIFAQAMSQNQVGGGTLRCVLTPSRISNAELYIGIHFSIEFMSSAEISSIKDEVSRPETLQVIFRSPKGRSDGFQGACHGRKND